MLSPINRGSQTRHIVSYADDLEGDEERPIHELEGDSNGLRTATLSIETQTIDSRW